MMYIVFNMLHVISLFFRNDTLSLNKSFQLAICSLFYFWNGAIFSNENEIKILNLEMKYLSSNVNVLFYSNTKHCVSFEKMCHLTDT